MSNIFSKRTLNWGLAAAVSGLLLASGCASTSTPEQRDQVAETNDPLEPMNRYFFDLNLFFQEFALKPAAAWYSMSLPQPAQNGVHKFLQNMKQPWTMVNDALQGNFDRAGESGARFLINSTLGVGGIFDVATDWGFPEHNEDFGQTLAVWGLGDGPYLMLPFIGPSNLRDTAALPFDWYLDPVNIAVTNYVPIPDHSHPRQPPHHEEYTWFPTARGFVGSVDEQARNGDAIEQLKKQSMDFYATVRSIYRQRRDAQIHNRGEGENGPSGPVSSTPTDVPPEADELHGPHTETSQAKPE
ncbi:MAG TPA: VacJ family lipoprotein [Alphaproteobacteria bacterium]|nr:VacJ family lipoprotein [Alphaproteobacteria bacterium]